MMQILNVSQSIGLVFLRLNEVNRQILPHGGIIPPDSQPGSCCSIEFLNRPRRRGIRPADFITSADSATFVLGMQSTNGSLTPPNNVKLVWGIIQSTIAVILLSVNGLTALQKTIIIAELPLSFVMLIMVVSLLKALKEDTKSQKTKY